MSSVANLNPPQRRIWVCACGCSTFNLMSDGAAICANCEWDVMDANDPAGWVRLPAEAEYAGERSPYEDVQGNGSVDFARARIGRLAKDDDVELVVLARTDGTVHAWGTMDTVERLDWARERLVEAAKLLGGKA